MISFLFLFNLLLTILIEGVLIFLLFRRWDFVYYSFLCNLLTNPALNLLLLAATRMWSVAAYWIALVVLESAAVIAEAYVYKLLCRFPPGKAFAVSFTVNTISVIVGYLVHQLDIIQNLFW